MATFFAIGLQTGSSKYKSWSVSSPDFDKDYVDSGSVYANYDLTALGGSRTVKNDVGCFFEGLSNLLNIPILALKLLE